MPDTIASAPKSWVRPARNGEKKEFLVSMDKSLLSVATMNEEFDKDYIYWAKSMPDEALQTAIDSSMCFGLYERAQGIMADDGSQEASLVQFPHMKQIGFARLVTDNVTFFYLSDVFVKPEYQGGGLGSFLVQCIKEVLDDMKHMRRFILMTGDKNTGKYYERLMDVTLLGEIGNAYILGRKGPGSYV
ncbi:acetyltransferase [Nannizzia gypsea CBS 118893]|uniref:Acetyltransferase n=1 Tax=Arthroderma gypseum (strain ATCC MYA-4604 / CBS 118893) TaxID=535722 RepID=E5R148_ARTGP|nr:acetyltransferase [Nannizzia gypsea CBS 118893]EFQ97652.1 acetyltransferase [Nannizzia gypsea CBS 118893]